MPPFIELPRWFIEVGFVAYAVAVVVVVVLERRRPTATLALILSMIFVPVAGLLVYLLFSRRRVRRRQRNRQRRAIDPLEGTRNLAVLDGLPAGLPERQRGLVRLALETAAAPLRRADRVTLLPSATEAYDALLEAIRGAERCVHLEFYIWKDDHVGRQVTALLTQRAAEGVDVRVLYDHVGSLGLATEHFTKLRQAGGHVAIYGRLRMPFRLRPSRVNFRNHRKLVTIDNRIGFVGGSNIATEYFGEHGEGGWRDLMVRVEGDAVIGLEATFLEDWLASTGDVVDLAGKKPTKAEGVDGRKPARKRAWDANHPGEQALRDANPFAPMPEGPIASDGPLVQMIPSGPDLQIAASIQAQFTATVAAAQTRAWIATPYFIPDEPLMLILRTAALRGVDVRILVPTAEHNDQHLVALASRSYFDELLEVGCRIFEYLPGMLHAKYLIADEVAAIGSANMDVRSFFLNYEITAMFYDEPITDSLAAIFEEDLEQAREVTARDRLTTSLPSRFYESFARVLSPLL
jgi:cardiolipin synthase